MAILLDEHARAALAHRRARGRDTTLLLLLVPARCRPRALHVEWLPRRLGSAGLVLLQQDDVVVCADWRVARYTHWCDVTLSAWRLGPWEGLTVVDEPAVVLMLLAWEETHPGVAPPVAAP